MDNIRQKPAHAESVCLRECIADMIKVALGIGNWQLRIWAYGTMQ